MDESADPGIDPKPTFTVHRCDNCGAIEGESPQAGCCPRCGVYSEPIPVKVVDLRAAREAGADAVLTEDGGLVRIMGGIEADAEYPYGGPDGTNWHMAVVPLDGGDDGA